MTRVGVIDYGVGNLRSVSNALSSIGADPIVSDHPKTLLGCSRIIFPGVGAFGFGMQALKQKGLDEVVLEAANSEIPLLGICVGMQLLFESSTELGYYDGLGIMKGHVDCLNESFDEERPVRLPNVGWSSLNVQDNLDGLGAKVVKGLPASSRYYFIHSYHAAADNQNTIATSCYDGRSFAAIVSKGSVIGTQFHPEKSGPSGLAMLKNFVR